MTTHFLAVDADAFEKFGTGQRTAIHTPHDQDFQTADLVTLVLDKHKHGFNAERMAENEDAVTRTYRISHVLPSRLEAGLVTGQCLLSLAAEAAA